MPRTPFRRWSAALLLTIAVAVTACTDSGGQAESAAEGATEDSASTATAADVSNEGSSPDIASSSGPADGTEDGSTEDAAARIEAIQTQVNTWAGTGDLATAQEAAEGARNLVVGEDSPYYGDATGNGVVTGDTGAGLLPGIDGQPGLADGDADNECVLADVLGGSWVDPAERWSILDTAIKEWSPTNNPFPGLPSHPQRIVGWATLTLESDDLDTAVEFAGHAQLHVDVSRDAYACG